MIRVNKEVIPIAKCLVGCRGPAGNCTAGSSRTTGRNRGRSVFRRVGISPDFQTIGHAGAGRRVGKSHADGKLESICQIRIDLPS